MADSIPPADGSQAPASPPKTGKGSLVWWGYLANYVLVGLGVLMIADMLWEAIDSGVWKWYRFGLPLLFIAIAILNFGLMHAQERKRGELGADQDRS
jgi:hypothetical protein